MKYILNSVATCSSRVGCIKDIQRLPGLVLETPMLLLHTKGGSIPHLTHEVLQKVTKEPQPLNIPISTVFQCQEAVSVFKKGIAEFIGMKEYLTFCTIHDPSTPTPQGFNDKDTVSLWPRSGRRQLDAEKYMDIIEAFQPDMYQTLCDGDTNLNSSKKRVQKSIDRTDTMFKKCLERHTKSEALKNSAVLGIVEGGYSIEAREKCAKEIADSPVFGFVVDGLHNNGPDVEHLAFKEVISLLEQTLKHLPKEKFRVIHGCWNPEMVLNLVEIGVDAFDSSFPHLVTERGGALVFHNTLKIPDDNIPNRIQSESIPDGSEPETKKKRLIESEVEAAVTNGITAGEKQGPSTEKLKESKVQTPNTKYEMSLSDKKYAGDFLPVSSSCSCLTCQKHTRAYIHHLLQTNELLGPVLLTIHNLHHYMEFFKSIREALKTNSLDRLRKYISDGFQVT